MSILMKTCERKYLIPKPLDKPYSPQIPPRKFYRKKTAHIHFLQECPAICIINETNYDDKERFAGHGYLLHTTGCNKGTDADDSQTVILPHGMWLNMCSLAQKHPIEVNTTWYDDERDIGYHIKTEEIRLHHDDPEADLTYRTIATIIFDSKETADAFQWGDIDAIDITDDEAYNLEHIWANQAFPERT